MATPVRSSWWVGAVPSRSGELGTVAALSSLPCWLKGGGGGVDGGCGLPDGHKRGVRFKVNGLFDFWLPGIFWRGTHETQGHSVCDGVGAEVGDGEEFHASQRRGKSTVRVGLLVGFLGCFDMPIFDGAHEVAAPQFEAVAAEGSHGAVGADGHCIKAVDGTPRCFICAGVCVYSNNIAAADIGVVGGDHGFKGDGQRAKLVIIAVVGPYAFPGCGIKRVHITTVWLDQ